MSEEPAGDTSSSTGTSSTGATMSASTTNAPTTTMGGTVTGEASGDVTDGSANPTGPIDPDMFCAQFTDRDACQQAEPPPDVFCGWTVSTPVRLVNGACQLNTASGVCSRLTGGTTVGGCFPPEGCESEPFFSQGDGEVHVIFQCGGSLPVGYEPCVLVEPGLFDPPECGCLCEEGFGTDDGGTTGESTSTG